MAEPRGLSDLSKHIEALASQNLAMRKEIEKLWPSLKR